MNVFNSVMKGCRIFPDLKCLTFLFEKFSLLEKLVVVFVRSSETLPFTVQIAISLTKSKPHTETLHKMSKIAFVNFKPNSHMNITRHVIRMRNRLLFRRHYGSENDRVKHLLANALFWLFLIRKSTPCSVTRNTLQFRK